MHTLHTETTPPGGVESLAERFAALLGEARGRTLELIEPVCDQDLERVHSTLMSPLVWDLGHIAAFEDLWLCRNAGGLEPLYPELLDVYDATETPRSGRGELGYLRCEDARRYLEAVRDRALDVLAAAELGDGSDPLNARGFVWEMVVRHEQQHNETMLQTLKLAEPGVFGPERRPLPDGAPDGASADRTGGDGAGADGAGRFAQGAGGDGAGRFVRASDAMVRVEGGPFPLGLDPPEFGYDNERPAHEVHLPPFLIDRLPVTNGAYREFVEAGGYRREDWWSENGWEWKEREGIESPLFWSSDGTERSFDRIEEIDPDLPVMHVSWFEADAFARSRGKRLPTEAEWEKAACWDGETKRRFPWGHEPASEQRANLDQTGFGPARAGAYGEGASPCGALGMVGDAWEWTASDFAAYPGFRAFPYREYSELFFGDDYKVLRGGSWATRSRVASATFRNWDFPQRRQIFSGFRCAKDAS